MNNIWQLTNPLPRPVEEIVLRVNDTAEKTGVSFFLAGAMAREINLLNIHDRPPARRTRDIDFAISVKSWDTFCLLKDGLLQNNFKATKEAHRLLCADTEIPVDIIPFGGLADKDENISWPPEHAITMSVSGFAEAYHSSVTFNLSGKAIKLASLPGLTLLKLLAWKERRLLNKKDVTDFFTIVSEYQHIELDRLYEDNVPAEQLAYDPSRLGSWVLGDDTRRVCSEITLTHMKTIRNQHEQLIDDLFSVLPTQNTESLEVLVWDFWQGFEH